jgi:histidyl-tRNA synthetase
LIAKKNIAKKSQLHSVFPKPAEKLIFCEGCRAKFEELQGLLKGSGIDYVYNPCLVRGLDYYTNAVFEIKSESLGSQDAIGAGGRYNNLIKNLGGPEVPACGFALGVERIMLALNKQEDAVKSDVFIAVIGENLRKESFEILKKLRDAGIRSDMDYCAKSLKGQLRYAEKNGINFVILIAEDEYKQGLVILKDMEASSQEKIKKENIVEAVRSAIADGEGIA